MTYPNPFGRRLGTAGLLFAVAVFGLVVGGGSMALAALSGAAGLALLLLFLSLRNPEVLAVCVIMLSAFAGLLAGIENRLAETSLPTLSGLLWIVVTGGVFLFVLPQWRQRRMLFRYRYLVLFALWATLLLPLSPDLRAGGRHVLYYAMIPLMALYTSAYVNTRIHAAQSINRLLILSLFIPAGLYCLAWPSGLVELTAGGPYGIINPRPTALFVLMVLPVALAAWRYGNRFAGVGVLVGFATVAFTLSRTALVTAVVLVLTARIGARRVGRLVLSYGLAVSVSGALLLGVPQFRERMFERTRGQEEFVLSERGILWSLTGVGIAEKPILGWGPGAARTRLGELLRIPGGTYPHNEYLQVYHDTGVIGFVLFVLAWASALQYGWIAWREGEEQGDRPLAERGMRVFLLVQAVLLTSFTDNTLHYPFLIGIVGLALENTPSSGSAVQVPRLRRGAHLEPL